MTRPDARSLHVLYVAWGLAHGEGPEGARARALATVGELVRQGHRVTVLTADLATANPAAGGEPALGDLVPDSVRVVQVAMAPQQRDPLLNRWSEARLADPQGWEEQAAKDQVRAFPEVFYSSWQPRAEAVAARLQELDPIDLVIATARPYVDFVVALRLHVDHAVPFVLDDTDSWLPDLDTGGPGLLAVRIEAWLEFGLSQAVRMWFVNPAAADRHRLRFPQHSDRIRVVGDGADPRQPDTAGMYDAAAGMYGAARTQSEWIEPALRDVLTALAS
jgi:hypothetical protein